MAQKTGSFHSNIDFWICFGTQEFGNKYSVTLLLLCTHDSYALEVFPLEVPRIFFHNYICKM